MTSKFKVGSMAFGIDSVRRKSGGGVKCYCRLRWSLEGRQKEKLFTDIKEARQWAREYNRGLTSGGIQLGPKEADIWRIMQQEKPEGMDLLSVWRRGVDSIEAERAKASRPVIDVSAAVGEWLDKLEKDEKHGKISFPYLRGIRSYMKRASSGFQISMSDFTVEAVQEWLDGQDLSPKGKLNMRGYLSSFVRWSHSRGYLKTDKMALTVPRETSKDSIGVFTPEQMADILRAWPVDFRLPVVVGAFAGLRTAEIHRLEWKDIRNNHIHLSSAQTKTGVKRVVPVLPVLQEWLDIQKGRRSGKIVAQEVKDLGTRICHTSRKLGIKWVTNGLRHSFCSYRLAMTRNAASVALEAGNNPNLLLRRYNEAVTEQEAEKWFSLNPGKVL